MGAYALPGGISPRCLRWDGGYLIAYHARSPTDNYMIRFKMTRTDLPTFGENPEVGASSTTLAMPTPSSVSGSRLPHHVVEANASGVQ